jgi:hypothetical protein
MIDVVFDGFPSPDGPKFIEVETDGKSVIFGEWKDLRDGYKALSFPNPRAAMESALSKLEAVYDPEDEVLYRVRADLEAMINEFPR